VNGERLTVGDIAFIRAYLRQWIESPVWQMNPHLTGKGRRELRKMRNRTRDIKSEADIACAVSMMVAAGMDPL